VNSIVIDENHPANSPGRDAVTFGHGWKLFALAAVAIVGCLLFIMSRKLAWGRDEPLTGWLRWSFAALPYVIYFTARQFASLSQRMLTLVKQTDFLPIWTLSLLLFVTMRGSTVAPIYESQIYRATEPDFLRYAILSGIYVGSAAILVTAWRAVTRHLFATQGRAAALRLSSTIVAWMLFCGLIFIVTL
jgi:hypothetical protein